MNFVGLNFILDGGFVSVVVAIVLVVMSILSWYFGLSHAYRIVKQKQEIKRYTQKFWQADNLASSLNIVTFSGLDGIVRRAIAATQHYQNLSEKKAAGTCSKDEFVVRAINRAISEKTESYERGLSILASVGSIAPFVGLFGTVWGIYHALLSISQSGQATLDKVAGPVGEALIMTAIGLAVAIPAVLAYNAILRANRVLLLQVEQFCEELHVLLTTGAAIQQLDQSKINKENLHAVEKLA